MDTLANLPPTVLVVLAVLLAVWLILLLLVPFMIEGIRSSTRKANLQLGELNQKVDKLIALLERRDAATAWSTEPRDARPHVAERARKEPTISG
jgi:predicted PurR-regulated permease PerM